MNISIHFANPNKWSILGIYSRWEVRDEVGGKTATHSQLAGRGRAHGLSRPRAHGVPCARGPKAPCELSGQAVRTGSEEPVGTGSPGHSFFFPLLDSVFLAVLPSFFLDLTRLPSFLVVDSIMPNDT